MPQQCCSICCSLVAQKKIGYRRYAPTPIADFSEKLVTPCNTNVAAKKRRNFMIYNINTNFVTMLHFSDSPTIEIIYS